MFEPLDPLEAFIISKHTPMKLSGILLLALASTITLSFVSMEENPSENPIVELRKTFKNAITESNENVGTDSLYLSEFDTEYQPDEYLIYDHLVIVNDLKTQSDLLSKDIKFSIGAAGYLELIDFDLKELESPIINYGSVSLNNCLFEEGKNLTKLITNRGEFSITNGKFEGSSEGDITRDAVFAHSAKIIL